MKQIKILLALIVIATYITSCGDAEMTSCEEKTWYQDADGDGLGDEMNTLLACNQPSGYVANSDDDNDSGIDEDLDMDNEDFDPVDWTDETHSKDADPNFDEVFDDNAVKRIDIVISPENWEVMQSDMVSLYGAFGSGGRPTEFADENPIWVPSEVFYNGKQWYRVGARFKGNSSLSGSWSSGIGKLSFKLDFDEFEDDYPQIKNQRFYGFKKLSLKNNYDDQSIIREKVAGDLFRDAGLVGPHTAFYTVYVDYGEGAVYHGVYTMVEEVDDTVIDTQYADDDGNLYKPDGDGASFAKGTFSEEVFGKETNEDEGDWSDIQTLFSVLHDESRTSEPAVWRASLDEIFDTDIFLKYLAVNTIIQNWDTYGRMTHNYFMYNDPATNKLTWIPWDNNEALQDGKRDGSLNLDFSDLNGSSWPLIGFLYADAEYRAVYEDYLSEIKDGVFKTSSMQSLYDEYAELIEPFANAETRGYTFLSNGSSFLQAISTLKNHVAQREAAVNQYF